VVNTVVVWLHILGPYWCLSVALFGSRLLPNSATDRHQYVQPHHHRINHTPIYFIPLNAELNPTCHLLALLGVHHIFHVSRIRVNGLF